MPGLLQHSPADILRVLLNGENLGWPVFTDMEPPSPDNCITTYNTDLTRHGRLMTGQTQGHHGIQVRVRSNSSPVGWKKINEITIKMESVYEQIVTIGVNSYLVHSVNHLSGPVFIGPDEASKRMLHTVNFLTYVKPLGD